MVTEGTVTTNTNYLGGFQYKNNVLEFFPTAEGYVKNTAGALSYVFQYKDHLGNIRVSYAKNPTTQVLEIIEENNYYSFGLKHKGYNDYVPTGNKLSYNSKELQDELGLNVYDYSARNYDPALGRWMNIDPLAEQMRRFSPYNYAFNNPVYFIDPDGMAPGDPVGPGYYSAFKTTRTIGFGLRHPSIALSIGDVTHNSTNISTNSARFSINTGLPENDSNEGSHINAFRHVLWQAEITDKFGSKIAKEVGNAHEENPYAATGSNLQMTFSSLADADQTIDLLNNQIGRKIGEATKGQSMQEKTLAILDYFNYNGLYTAIPNVDSDGTITTWSVGKTILTGDQYNNAKVALTTTNDNGYTPTQQASRDEEVKAEVEAARQRTNAIKGPKF